jgi:hypothetical protein
MDRGRALIDSQSILLTLCATESPVNSLDCDVALLRVHVAVIRGQVNSRDNKGKEEEIQELRTCRICKKLFQPVHNHPQACRYHTAHFGGGSGNSFFLSFFFNGFCFSFFFFWLISLNSPRCHSMYEECQSITIICTLWGFGILLSPQASSSMDSFFIFCLFHVFAHLL